MEWNVTQKVGSGLEDIMCGVSYGVFNFRNSFNSHCYFFSKLKGSLEDIVSRRTGTPMTFVGWNDSFIFEIRVYLGYITIYTFYIF